MAKILRLDLGTNSVGWAVVETDKLNLKDFMQSMWFNQTFKGFKTLKVFGKIKLTTN